MQVGALLRVPWHAEPCSIHMCVRVAIAIEAPPPPTALPPRCLLQRKAEIKRNIKKAKREADQRQALAALSEAGSPRMAGGGRPKKASGHWAAVDAQFGGFGGGAAGSAMAASTPGEMRSETPGPEFNSPISPSGLVDPLAQR